MSDVILYLGICILGYLLGMLFRKRKLNVSWLGTAEIIAVLILIFSMGLRVGSNREVIASLGTLGLYAVIFTLVIQACSVLAVFLFRKVAGFDAHGLQTRGKMVTLPAGEAAKPAADLESKPAADLSEARIGAPLPAGAMQPTGETGGTEAKKTSLVDKGTIRMVLFVALGILCGYLLMRFSGLDPDRLDQAASLVITVGLCVLLIFIGFDLGSEGDMLDKIRSIGPYALVLPLMVMIGTFAGSALCSVFLPVSLKESLAIGAGFAWYSLAPGIIMEAGYITTGAISFLHNVMRELFSILLVPLVARKIGYLEAVSLPGSPAMDVCLPVVVQSTNANTAIFSFTCGFILSTLVPFIVPLFV